MSACCFTIILLLYSFQLYVSQSTSPFTSWAESPPALPHGDATLLPGYYSNTNKIYLIGGSINSSSDSNVIWYYDISGNYVVNSSSLPFALGDINAQSSTYFENFIYFVNNQLLHRFDMSTETLSNWNRTLHAVDIHAPCVSSKDNQYILIIGGEDLNNPYDAVATFQIYDIQSDTFHIGDDLNQKRRRSACNISPDGNFLYIFGGQYELFNNGSSGVRNRNNIEKINITNMNDVISLNALWSVTSMQLTNNLYSCRSVVDPINNLIYIIGGRDENGNAADSVQIIDLSTDSISESAVSLNTGRSSPSVIINNQITYVFGGRDGGFFDTFEMSNVLTWDPTPSPTIDPTMEPTYNPTQDPTVNPTWDPTFDPTLEPTLNPTGNPTINPTYDPTEIPTNMPTEAPTNPTDNPTVDPTYDPTKDPTWNPTTEPTSDPTNVPTNPTVTPTTDPSVNPTMDPTSDPTIDPTYDPTADPTRYPTSDPTDDPTEEPTINPSVYPTYDPTINPTHIPTVDPTTTPTAEGEARNDKTSTTVTTLYVDENNIDNENKPDAGVIIGVLIFAFVILILCITVVLFWYKNKNVLNKSNNNNSRETIELALKHENNSAVGVGLIASISSNSNGIAADGAILNDIGKKNHSPIGDVIMEEKEPDDDRNAGKPDIINDVKDKITPRLPLPPKKKNQSDTKNISPTVTPMGDTDDGTRDLLLPKQNAIGYNGNDVNNPNLKADEFIVENQNNNDNVDVTPGEGN